MERNLKRYYLIGTVASFMAYFLGDILYTLMFGGDEGYSHIMGFAFAAIVIAVMLVYEKRSKSLKSTIRRRDNDERIALIRGKASYFTVGVTLLILVCTVIVSIILSYPILSIYASALYVVMIALMIVAHRRWSRRI